MLEKKVDFETALARLREFEWTFTATLKGKEVSRSPETFYATVYGAYLCSENNLGSAEALEGYLEDMGDERRYLFIKDKTKNNFSIPVEFCTIGKYSKEDYLLYFRYFSELAEEIYGFYGVEKASFNGTPDSISKLACSVLDIKKKDSLSDLGCGIGNFLCVASDQKEKAVLFGLDINTDAVDMASIRAEVLGIDVKIEQGNLFDLDINIKYSKIFSNFPFGSTIRNVPVNSYYFEELSFEIPDLRKGMLSEWAYVAKIVKHIKEGGKAVVVMTNGSSWNALGKNIRRFFVEAGYIEAVIALPSRMFPYIQAPTDMLILSHENSGIRMVDASEICIKGRRQTTFSDENIKEIVSLLKKDSDKSKHVNKEILYENDFVINPSRYTDAPIEMDDGVKFGSVIKRITRGAQLNASQLDKLVTEKNTGLKYLMLSDIRDGIISEDLKNLSEVESRLEKYFIPDGALLLSKNGAPFKVAVAEIKEGEKILGNGNLFIIELDRDRVNPYYLKAFFHSEIGSTLLKKISVGSTLPNISAESLKNLSIPLPSMKKQNKIAEMYQAKVDEVKVLQRRLNKAQEELRGIFGEVD